MTTNKAANTTSQPTHECCMCGDYGFSYELFQCKVCQFRSQHRYCSNLYPNIAESHRICNWCLNQKDQAEPKLEKSQNSSNSSSSGRNDAPDDHETKINTKINKLITVNHNVNSSTNYITDKQQQGSTLILRRQGLSSMKLQLSSGPIKKQRSVEAFPAPSPSPSPAVPIRKRILTNGAKEERLRRTRSEEISNASGITKQVFRNKVRRYKLLDEVSS